MDKINVLLIVTLISIFISLILAFFLLTVKTKYKTSNILFAVFLILAAVDLSEPLFNLVVDGPSNLGMLRTTLAFLQIPVFYLYVVSVCYSDFKLKPKYFFHLLPFLIVNIVLLPRFYTVDLSSKINFIINRQHMIELQFIHILFHIQFVVYFIAVFILLRKTKKLYLENNAGTHLNSYNWLFQFTVVLTVLYSIALLKNIFKFSDYPYISEWIKFGILVIQPFIFCWYLFKALNNPELFRNVDSKLQLVAEIILEEKNKEQSVANEDNYNEELLKLRSYMIEKKPFLNPSVTIQDISENIQIPTRELSVLINHQLGQHFYDFVNTYRIESAMEILKDTTKSKVTILEILYEVGFNSKSSFNTAFKKHTGNTPTYYRNNLQISSL
ncbi:AraC family transcriptional regulator [Chryseobacterium lactis]|uniref:AraC family transcriptional regulator n=1 Tax=Chryseobacterium lactis TaxID=1241981 RepID=A0A3G6RP35_CHRLC|nr:helix-turn-helix domain-containing protein [Chryseobacterium lactis]AZA84399.1 AraC family transcriptional regulator [Chryseobacterium lactis]AZB04787.1 AraC family transcriptional regulator [Chryseobacterium lactis]PNW14518.1 AraC family transcriptional regulator [Chryseobacterium lactis]